jgi:hypothetical protein
MYGKLVCVGGSSRCHFCYSAKLAELLNGLNNSADYLAAGRSDFDFLVKKILFLIKDFWIGSGARILRPKYQIRLSLLSAIRIFAEISGIACKSKRKLTDVLE